MRFLLFLILTFQMAIVNAELAPLQIRSAVQSVGFASQFYLSPFDPNLIENKAGYSPKIPAELIEGEIGNYIREDTTSVLWDFGDGSTPKNTDDKISASHVYKKPGDYTVKVKLLDSNWQVREQATLDISVKPGILRVSYSALPITATEPTRLSFTAATFQRELDTDEKVVYLWDFGDGNTREGENLDQVNHTYAISGDYKTTLTVTNNFDTEGNSRRTISVVAANTTEVTHTADVLVPPDVIDNQVNLQISGNINGELNAASKPIAGSVFLASTANDNCRLWINFWDDAQLAHGSLLLNLGVLPGEISNFEFNGEQRLDMYFFPSGKTYLDKKRTLGSLMNTENVGNAMHSYGKEAGFRMSSGAINFTLKNNDYLVGTISAGLGGNLIPKGENDKDLLIGATGDFTLNLGSRGFVLDAIQQGFACIEQDFYEVRRFPQARQKHVGQDRPIIWVNFNQEIQLDSVNNESFQVGYPDADGNFVKVAGRFINDKTRIRFVPDKALRDGVRYTIKYKIGEEGVLSAGGSFIKDHDGSGWQESEFWTELPFSNDASSPSNLSCDVYQSVKNVPLIVGKPALLKIYADWPKYNDVHESAQYEEFDAMVKIGDGITKPLGDQAHKFTRTDLREDWSKSKLREEEAALYPFMPSKSSSILGHLSVNNYDGNGGTTPYFFNCSTTPWDLAPELKVDVFALNFGNYGYDNDAKTHLNISNDQTSALIKRFTNDAKVYAEQLFPLQAINFSEPKFIDEPNAQELDGLECGASCYLHVLDLILFSGSTGTTDTDSCGVETRFNHLEFQEKKLAKHRKDGLFVLWQNKLSALRRDSDAHLIVLLGSHELLGGGGHTKERLSGGQGLVFSTVGESRANYDRYVFGLVHEIGHTLTLEHTPYLKGCAYKKFLGPNSLELTHHYEGLDGIRQSADGTQWWHKSSILGNEESKNIMPLLYPKTMPTDDAFILRNHYRAIQEMFESLGPEFK